VHSLKFFFARLFIAPRSLFYLPYCYLPTAASKPVAMFIASGSTNIHNQSLKSPRTCVV